MLQAFANEPVWDLGEAGVRSLLARALAQLDDRLPIEAGSRVGGASAESDGLRSTDPAHPDRLVAVADRADDGAIDRAVSLAAGAGTDWSASSPSARARILLAAVDLVQRDRAPLSALMVREAGKTWDEADAEVAEAVDFLRFYANAALEFPDSVGLPTTGTERNSVRLLPRGVTAVVAPWNFPIAIPLGMTVAALAGGNPVVLKPAEQTPACGAVVVRILLEAGVPPAALALLQGDGATGASLIRHPTVATVAFTGSTVVGREIAQAVAHVADDQRYLKRLVAELGGKNCAIVASDADVKLTCDAITRSAFSYAGQKCSAVSRVLVEDGLADELSEHLVGAVARLTVGEPEDFETFVPPLIESTAATRLRGAAEQARSTGRIIASGTVPDQKGHYVPPEIVAGLPESSDLCRTELFGPLLIVERVGDVHEACDRVDALPLALVGGVYSTSRETIDAVVKRSPVGNLYINRPTVGALVGRQPFGGGRLSGTGHKAGGSHYVAAFCEQQVVCEALS